MERQKGRSLSAGKRFLALLVAALMVVNVLPLSAFAQAIETVGINRAPVPSKAGTRGDRDDTIEIEGVYSTIVGGATTATGSGLRPTRIPITLSNST